MSLKKIRNIMRQTGSGSVSMQRKLVVYWLCMSMTVFAGAVLILTLAGMVPGSGKNIGQALRVQEQSTVSTLSRQMDALTAQGIALSGEITQELDRILAARDKKFEDLNNNPELIRVVESSLYDRLETVLRSSECSGVFFVLDATVNTAAERADHSRMGLYLRFSDLKTVGTLKQHVVFFRGAADVAREKQVQMHNRWNLEVDIARLPGYEKLMSFDGERLAAGCRWSERVRLQDTWENAMLLLVPVRDGNGIVRGVCGIELSDLYFSLSYPATDSSFGSMITLLTFTDGKEIYLDKTMIGNTSGTYLKPAGIMQMETGRYGLVCRVGKEKYYGVIQKLPMKSVLDTQLSVLTVSPEGSYWHATVFAKQIWIGALAGFLILILGMIRIMSGRFVKPIVRSLQGMQEDAKEETGHSSGILEIDALEAFVRQKKSQPILPGELPPEIEELLCDFSQRTKALTPTERSILRLFIDGCDIQEAAEKSFISLGTARKHNTNINKKLGISNREELMLYIDLFRRSNRLNELYNPQ